MQKVITSPYPPLPPTPEVNFYHILLNRPEQADWPDYEAQIDAVTDERRSFYQVRDTVKDGITALGAQVPDGGLGLRPGDGEIVGILSDNTLDYSSLVLSLLGNTTPFALFSSFSTRFELEHAMKLSKATRVFVSPKHLQKLLPLVKTFGLSSKNIHIIGGHVKGYKSFGGMISRLRERNVERLPVQSAQKNTLAYLVFSSGTSGLPKAVMISHGNLKCAFLQAVESMKAGLEVYQPPPPKRKEGIPAALAFLPMHHSYGLHAYVFRPLLMPSTVVMMPRWNVDWALKAIPKYEISSLALVPSMAHQLANHPKIRETDLSSIQAMNSGAAYLPPDLAAKLGSLKTRSAILSQGYGMSECTIAATGLGVDGALGKRKILSSVGQLLAGMEARIVKEDGSDAEREEVGELWLKGCNIALGYWNNPKASAETFLEGGWLRTGDHFKVDAEGNFYFVDRAKDTLKISGAQVSPSEIEDVLLAHPDKLIIDASVAGVSGGRTDDERVPRAWIVLSAEGKKKGDKEVKRMLREWTKENLSPYKQLRGGIEVVKQIPKLPTGKVLRRKLVDRYEASHRQGRVKAKL